MWSRRRCVCRWCEGVTTPGERRRRAPGVSPRCSPWTPRENHGVPSGPRLNPRSHAGRPGLRPMARLSALLASMRPSELPCVWFRPPRFGPIGHTQREPLTNEGGLGWRVRCADVRPEAGGGAVGHAEERTRGQHAHQPQSRGKLARSGETLPPRTRLSAPPSLGSNPSGATRRAAALVATCDDDTYGRPRGYVRVVCASLCSRQRLHGLEST
jgi:hypothetical protein